jgi:trigger factor
MAMQSRINLKDVAEEDVRSVVVEKVGEPALDAFVNQFAMAATAHFAITEKALDIVMEPQTETSEEIKEGRDFSYTLIATPKPSYELESYDPVSVKLQRPTVTDEEVEQRLYYVAEQRTQSVPEEGAVAEAGKEMVFSIDTTDKESGEKIDNLTAPRRIYQIGEGFLPEDFDEGIKGMKPGESRTFDWGLPGMEGTEPKPVTSTIEILQINKKVIPAVTDAWVEDTIPGAKTVDDLREMIRREGMEFKEKEFEDQKFFVVASELAKRFKGRISDDLYEYTRTSLLQNLTQSLEQQGMTLEQYLKQMGMEEQQFSMSVMMQVRETLRQGFALDALAKHLKLTLTEADIEDAIHRIAPGNEERARQEYEGTGRTYLLNEAALRTKANKWLLETANIEYVEGA